jgi:hypothetical protein
MQTTECCTVRKVAYRQLHTTKHRNISTINTLYGDYANLFHCGVLHVY